MKAAEKRVRVSVYLPVEVVEQLRAEVGERGLSGLVGRLALEAWKARSGTDSGESDS